MTKIYRVSVIYHLLRVYSNFIFKRWFSSVEVNGLENIPENASVIFAPNHQNAFVDAMALLSTAPAPVVFLAKATIFQNPICNNLLRRLKIMPAYRMRDGIQNLNKNEASFDEAVKVLGHNEYFCLMPEGGQEEVRKLRPLVKGMFRIAFKAYSQKTDGSDVYIVPMGIDYGDYNRSGGHLVVSYDKPIKISEYFQQWEADGPVTQNKLRDILYSKMSPLMLNIQTDAHYDAIYTACYLYNLNMLDEMGCDDDETNRLAARQRIAAYLDKAAAGEEGEARLKELDALTQQWHKKYPRTEADAVSLDDKGFDAGLLSLIIYCVAWAIPAIYCFLVNLLSIIMVRFSVWKFGEKGYFGSISLGVLIFFTPLDYLLFGIVLGFPVYHYFGTLTLILFILTILMSAFMGMKYWWRLKALCRRLRNCFRKENLTDSIADKTAEIINEVKAAQREESNRQVDSPK